jgi:hypothetical protein
MLLSNLLIDLSLVYLILCYDFNVDDLILFLLESNLTSFIKKQEGNNLFIIFLVLYFKFIIDNKLKFKERPFSVLYFIIKFYV